MTNYILRLFCIGLIVTMAGSCRTYKQDIMLRVEDLEPGMLRMEVAEAERNYTIQPDDLLEVAVYTNKGERIIDPDFALMRELSAGAGQVQSNRISPKYLVQENGLVRLPMIGEIELEGYTLKEADSILSRAYNEYYKETFVLTSFVNKRVVVLGATGGMVIPLPNENMNLLEVLALAGGITGKGKSYNIRLISGDLDNPRVQLIDLSTIEGMRKASLQVHSGDIVYVEPMRKVLTETIRDITPVISLVTSALTLLVIIVNLNSTP